MIREVAYAIDAVMTVVRVFILVSLALFLPRIFLYHVTHNPSHSFKLGLETVSESILKSLTPMGDLSYRVGLITNQTGCDQKGHSNINILSDKGLRIQKIFTPEHGFVAYKELVINTGNMAIPLINLYDRTGLKKIKQSHLKDVDVLFFDLQDAGMRHYSYLQTLKHVLEVGQKHNKPVVVLDRPNLLGSAMEGTMALQQEGLPIPVRYGMTVGELAQYFNIHVLKVPANLRVIAMENYVRQKTAFSLRHSLSPNIASLNSCYGYSFLGLIGEVSPFDIGVGTDTAFQCILLPESILFKKQKWYELAEQLKGLGIQTAWYRYFSTRKNQHCSGLRLQIKDINKFSSFNALLTVLNFFKSSGIQLAFSVNFDSAMGTSKVREHIEGLVTRDELEKVVNSSLQHFFESAQDAFLYQPLPKVVMV